MIRLTPVQMKMLEVLLDSLPHSDGELKQCLWDELGSHKNVRCHLTAIRKVLPDLCDVVRVVFKRKRGYQLVRLNTLTIDSDGDLV